MQAEIATAAAASDARSGSAERIVGDFWSSANASACDIEAIAPELARIEQLDNPAAIAAYLRDRHARGLGVVFRVDVAPDFANPATSIAFVAPAGIGLPDRDDYFDATSHGIARRRAYLAHVQATLEISGSAQVAAFAEDVLALETRLAEGMASRRELAR
ncbi:MAG TPA: M13 family metallopeptidase N-terminal domain-containing protein, partial [Rhodanobacteraceae bacterium]|nr:M13 family metallopeptidase N-terminal domain-containing protein [Rhodanobacteraceae bacterium]